MEPDKDTAHPAAAPEALTLRDLIAMSALTGLLNRHSYVPFDDAERVRSAREAYAMADAMLAARAA